ncbi:MAG: hypothetical protein MJ162_06025 [Treponema sp.]|nr:hypothetical protein [Treponema sp.]
MAQDVLTVAWKYLKRRNFATAIKLLEDRAEVYEDNFEYYLMLGIACLYVGDIGSSVTYFQQARRIKITDTRLLLGQAAIFLRRGETDRALQYYMEIQELEPGHKIAANAMEFIRTRGDYDTICRWVDTGRIEQFYPPLGPNPHKIFAIAVPVLACLIGCVVALLVIPKPAYTYGDRSEIQELKLSSEEKTNPQERDLSTSAYSYVLTAKQITDGYNAAVRYYYSKRDNAAQIEINKILNSNANFSIKQKSQILMTYLESPTFDTLTDNPEYAEVEADSNMYMDCWVAWGGKIANAVLNPDGTYSCQLLVGYDTGSKIEGIVTVKFTASPNIAPDQPVRILGQIKCEDQKIYLQGKSIYQSVKNGMR